MVGFHSESRSLAYQFLAHLEYKGDRLWRAVTPSHFPWEEDL
ncbi:hypothetical protein [Nostoc sp.]